MAPNASTRIYLDFHVLQTVPPSCVNRDDTGSPKTAFYGGVRRARVSSQAWKSAMRKMFKQQIKQGKTERLTSGTRTKRIVDMVAEKITARDADVPEDKAREMADRIIQAAGVQTADGLTKALFFISDFQVDNLARFALEADSGSDADKDALAEAAKKTGTKKSKKSEDGLPPEIKKALKNALNEEQAVDVALFGRMVADDPSFNADASAQVAHALSTHKVDNEFDYYTARDDRAPDDTPAADMIGTVEFNSSTLYRYATVAAHDLFGQLANDPDALAEAVREFARAFVLSMPTGKQNTFANRTVPCAVMVALRTDRPVNLADAFEEPVHATEHGGFAKRSVDKLARHALDVYKNFNDTPDKTWLVGSDWKEFPGEAVAFDALLDALGQEMRTRFVPQGN